ESLRSLPAIPTSRIVASLLISMPVVAITVFHLSRPDRGLRTRERRRRSRHNTAAAAVSFAVTYAPGASGMQRSEERILTTHAGSLVRPRTLVDAPAEGRDAKAIDAELARAVEDVVRRQVDVGLDIVNDGEFGKSSWAAYILERISGFEIRDDVRMPLRWLGRDRERFADFFAEEMPRGLEGDPTEVCVAPIEYRDERGDLARDIVNLRRAADLAGASEVFMTAVAP